MPDPYDHNQNTQNQEAWQIAPPVVRADTGTATRVDLDPEKFDALVQEKGVMVKVHRTLFCPGVQSVDGAEHDINCTLCNGSGWLDTAPLRTLAFLQSIALKEIAKIEGLVDGNSVSMTFPAGVELQYFTLIELMDFTEIYTQRVLRSAAGDVDILKYSACRVNVLIGRDGTKYLQDSDFELEHNGDVRWLTAATASKPADGEPYSIHYQAKVQFRAVRAAHVNRFSQHQVTTGEVQFIRLPTTWICQKEFLVRREDDNGNELKLGPYDTHTIVT